MINYELRKTEVTKRIMELKMQQMPLSKIVELIKKEFNVKCGIPTMSKFINNEINKINMNANSKDLIINKDDAIAILTDRMRQQLYVLNDGLKELTEKINSYKNKVFEWIDILEKDTMNYYKNLDKNDIKINDINAIKDSLLRSVSILESLNSSMMRNIEFFSKFIFKEQTGEVKEQNIQINLTAVKIVNDMEKSYGFFFIEPKTESFKKWLNEMEKNDEVAIFRNRF